MTPQERKVIELALEALENLMNQHYAEQTTSNDLEKAERAITAIKEALAQPEQDQDEVDIRSRLYQRIHELETQLAQTEQEPVLVECGNCHQGLADMEHVCKKCLGAGWVNNPQPKEPEQQPVAWRHNLSERVIGHKPFEILDNWTPLYTTPPQCTWVGLTDIEWSDLYEAHHDKYNLPKQGSPDGMDYERAIEA